MDNTTVTTTFSPTTPTTTTTQTTTQTTTPTTIITTDIDTTFANLQSTTTIEDDDKDINIALPIGIVVGAFLIGVLSTLLGIFIYRKYCVSKLRRESTRPFSTCEELSRRSLEEGAGYQGPYSVVDIERKSTNDGYMEVTGGDLKGTTASKSGKDSIDDRAPGTLPRPNLKSPLSLSQIQFNTNTNIEINTRGITVEDRQVEEDFYLDILPDESEPNIEEDNYYEDLSVSSLVAKEKQPSVKYQNVSKKPLASVKPKPKPKPQPKPRSDTQIFVTKQQQSTSLTKTSITKPNVNDTSSQRIKPNVPKKPSLAKVFEQNLDTNDPDISEANSETNSSNITTNRSNSQTSSTRENNGYENVNSTLNAARKTAATRGNDNIVMYVNCVVNGVSNHPTQKTEL